MASLATGEKRILFGDLHVHSTYSIDALVFSLPFFGGEGSHPPADACDFARHCAALDFFSINDHAEGLTPERWQRTIESMRACNERAGDPSDPDLVAFVGYEWTQVGPTPETHYGHKNVVFRGIGERDLPARPIAYLPARDLSRAPPGTVLRAAQWLVPREYADFLWLIERMAEQPQCERGVDARELPPDCRESADTPAELFEKLAQLGHDSLVIPHGLAWGIHTPRGSRLDNQLIGAQHDPERQRLLELWSGHGGSEEFRAIESFAANSAPGRCPAPTRDYLPCCWRAGQLMRERCGDLPADVCEARVEQAKRLALEAAVAPHLVFPDTRVDDWLDCAQCRDCFKPAFALRPGETAQYALALANFDEPGADASPRRFHFGFIASTDNHTARPGTGYKQYERMLMTDARGPATPLGDRVVRRIVSGGSAERKLPQPVARSVRSFPSLLDTERVSSFMYPGGLVAVHAGGRDRDAIWQALWRREVYGTSGPRILLWFGLLRGDGSRVPMGGELASGATPRFEVRATGAFRQLPGCPGRSEAALSPERLARLCRGECYHPGDERHRIDAIEVVRVRSQQAPGEDVRLLIEDPWLALPCPDDSGGCVVRFSDPEYAAAGRDTAYYVRALQEPTPAINGANLRTTFDENGQPLATRPCYGDFRTPAADDCLAPVRERAWSSPIYLRHP